MYTYVTKELPQLLESELPELKSNCRSGMMVLIPYDDFGLTGRSKTVMGHSMGGHGALICYLRNPGMYKVYNVTRASFFVLTTRCSPCRRLHLLAIRWHVLGVLRHLPLTWGLTKKRGSSTTLLA